MKFYLSSKVHKARITEADSNYVGSITIDKALCDLVGLEEGEKVMVVSNTSGNRLETYVIFGEERSGVICMNGAAAHLIRKGEEVIILGFTLSEQRVEPQQILVNKNNTFVKNL